MEVRRTKMKFRSFYLCESSSSVLILHLSLFSFVVLVFGCRSISNLPLNCSVLHCTACVHILCLYAATDFDFPDVHKPLFGLVNKVSTETS